MDARVLVFDGCFHEATISDNSIDEIYAELECDCFDIAYRKVGGKYFDIFCDDIGLFREDPQITMVSPDGKPMLVGNLLFANHDSEGNTTSLSDDDINTIIHALAFALSHDGTPHVVVIGEY